VIGKIRIDDKITYVDIPEDLVEQVMKHNGNYNVGKISSVCKKHDVVARRIE